MQTYTPENPRPPIWVNRRDEPQHPILYGGSMLCPDCLNPMDFVKAFRHGKPGSWIDEYTCICGCHIKFHRYQDKGEKV